MPKITNWGTSIESNPAVITEAGSIDDIVAVMKDKETYPSPVRAIGSNHSTTRCGVADSGTVLLMKRMNRIIEIDTEKMTVTAEPGAMYIDVAYALREKGLQFYVNVELGNLSLGSACCGGTKDASMPGEFGQVCSYAIAFKLVLPDGSIRIVDESEPELLQLTRSSYGLFGVVAEVTFKVRKHVGMRTHHKSYRIDDFARELPAIIARGESMMLYLFPFRNKVTVEFREYTDISETSKRWIWRLRNWVWKTMAPTVGYILVKIIPFKGLRYALVDGFNAILAFMLNNLVRGSATSAADQIIRYPETSGISRYTFSIWAFQEENYPEIVKKYFTFCRDYYKKTGYRCNMLNVGYRIFTDTSSLFSYSYHGNVMTLDPVSTGNPGWLEFIDAYNAFCSELGGIPLFNQTRAIRPDQAQKAFGEQLTRFNDARKTFDPDDRLLNAYFRAQLGLAPA